MTKWSKAIGTVDDKDRTEDTFKESRIRYLENVAETKNLGDCLIRQLRDRQKPATMSFYDYLDRRDELRRHMTNDLMRKTLALPTDQ